MTSIDLAWVQFAFTSINHFFFVPINRVGAVLGWWFAFTRDLRRERTFTIDDMPVAAGPYGVNQAASGDTAAPTGRAER
jgi:hypothetical protein